MADTNEVKPGYATTEFWITLLTTGTTMLALFTNKIHIDGSAIKTAAGILAVVVPTVVYTISRAFVKR